MWDPGLTKFITKAGDKLYRELVRHHMKKQSIEELMQAMLGEVEMLPENFQPDVELYIDAVNSQLAYDKEFWRSATVMDAFSLLMDISITVFSENNPMKNSSPMSPENHQLAMGLFQIPTMNFAYSAAGDKEMRKFTGIKKGFFS